MEFTHAIWEKRNMGVDCWEVEINESDTIEKFIEKMKTIRTQYMVVKTPCDLTEFGLELQKLGYSYIENIFLFKHDASLPTLNPLQKRIVDKMSYCEMDTEDIAYLFENIKNGMFTTDRVYKDPHFTNEQAYNRYIGWISDEIARGTKIFNIIYKDDRVGFFTIYDNGNGEFNSPIAGVYQNVKLPGLGIAMDYFEIKEMIRQNGKCVYATVSTNNRAALTIPINLGYIVEKVETVYIKHMED